MNVSADLLAGLGRAKDPNNGYFGTDTLFFGIVIERDLGVESRRRGLVVVDAIESDTKRVHRKSLFRPGELIIAISRPSYITMILQWMASDVPR